MVSTPKYVGEPSVESLASGLATLGRYGDEYMVHAAEGETVIPKEILDSNPQLKRDLFRQMMMMGIQDPNRYVVGSNLNSINPVTGQPEFFFKKIFKAVKKVFKKALPVIAPIVGNIIAPGIGGIIASGLVTKLQGGSWGDALKSAGMAWAGQGLMGGISGAMSTAPGATFFGGLEQGLTSPFTAIGKLTGSGGIGSFLSGSSPAAATAAAAKAGTAGAGSPALSASTASTPPLDGFVEGAGAPAFQSTAPIPSIPSIPTGAGPGDDLFAESLGGSGITQDATTLVAQGERVLPHASDFNLAEQYSDISYEMMAEQAAQTGSDLPPSTDMLEEKLLSPEVDWDNLPVELKLSEFLPGTHPSGEYGAESGDDFLYAARDNARRGLSSRVAPVPVATAPTEPIQQAAVPTTDLSYAGGDPGEFSSMGKDVANQGPQYIVTDPTAPPGSGANSMDRSFYDRFINPSKEAARLNRMESFNADYANEVKMAQGTGRTAPTVDDYWKTWAPKNPEAGFLRRIAPIGIAGAAGIGALTGAFDFEEEEQEFLNKNFDEASKEMQAYDEWKKIPASQRNSPQAQSLYFKWHGQPNRTRSQFEYLTGGRSSRPDWMFLP